ncbi:MAG: hypothetical protein WD080_01350, partial [Egibacteraceae bacterium]
PPQKPGPLVTTEGATTEKPPPSPPTGGNDDQLELDGFDEFVAAYPFRDGVPVYLAKAREIWATLSIEPRRQAWTGARHLAMTDRYPPDAHRFLLPPGGKRYIDRRPRRFEEWQAPPKQTRDVSAFEAVPEQGVRF